MFCVLVFLVVVALTFTKMKAFGVLIKVLVGALWLAILMIGSLIIAIV